MQYVTSRKNEYISHLRKLSVDSAYRYSCSEYICDGYKPLSDAIAAGAKITSILYKDCVPETLPDFCDNLYYSPSELFDYVSQMGNSPGPIFTVQMPDVDITGPFSSCVILENVQDPGNVGTIIRTANAFGINMLIMTGACADIYNPKTVRASMGGIFRQRIAHLNLNQTVELIRDNGMKLYASALTDKAIDIHQVDLHNTAIALGSEGYGLSDALISFADATVIIPMQACSESLNVSSAASVLMWEMVR